MFIVNRSKIFLQFTGGDDFFLLKYDSTGSLSWTRQTGTTGNDTAYGVAVSGDGFIYLTGCTAGNLNGQINAGTTTLSVALT